MQERDKALQSIRELITAKLDEIMQVDSEISGVKNETKKEGEISEELTKKLGKAKFELEVLQQRKDDIEADKNRLQEKFTMLKFSLSQTEEEGGRMDKERINVEADQNSFPEDKWQGSRDRRHFERNLKSPDWQLEHLFVKRFA